MAAKLVIEEERYTFRIYWAEDDDLGGHLCQDQTDGKGDPPKDRDDWEHWAASKAVRGLQTTQFDATGAYWESKKDAQAALRVAKEALKQDRPLPDWAQKALEAGWVPPKGWRA